MLPPEIPLNVRGAVCTCGIAGTKGSEDASRGVEGELGGRNPVAPLQPSLTPGRCATVDVTCAGARIEISSG